MVSVPVWFLWLTATNTALLVAIIAWKLVVYPMLMRQAQHVESLLRSVRTYQQVAEHQMSKSDRTLTHVAAVAKEVAAVTEEVKAAVDPFKSDSGARLPTVRPPDPRG